MCLHGSPPDERHLMGLGSICRQDHRPTTSTTRPPTSDHIVDDHAVPAGNATVLMRNLMTILPMKNKLMRLPPMTRW